MHAHFHFDTISFYRMLLFFLSVSFTQMRIALKWNYAERFLSKMSKYNFCARSYHHSIAMNVWMQTSIYMCFDDIFKKMALSSIAVRILIAGFVWFHIGQKIYKWIRELQIKYIKYMVWNHDRSDDGPFEIARLQNRAESLPFSTFNFCWMMWVGWR